LQETKTYEHGGRLNFNIILFYGDSSGSLHWREAKFCTMNDHGHALNFYLNNYFLWRTFLIWRWWA
jgi:hypothetical protein